MKLVANKPCNLNGKKYFIGEEVPVEEVIDYASLVKMGLLSVIHDAVPADNLEECVAMVGEVSFTVPIVKGHETIDLDVTEPQMQDAVKTMQMNADAAIAHIRGDVEDNITLIVINALDSRKTVKEAAEFEAQDKKRKEAIDTRNNADSMVFQVENALKEAGDKLDANDKASVEADLNALKDLLAQTANAQELTDSQVADIKAAQEKMMESAQKLFSKMYEQTQGAQGQAGPGPDMGNMGGNAGAQGGNEAGYGDDVVDADYKEV